MICPNCDYDMGYASACPNCGIDPVLFTKTYRMSDTLYNRGLAEAKQGDLSGAIDSLSKSIEFNKNNVTARNLLGLTYFQVGHIGDALKQWVISSSLLKNQNLAIYYLEMIQENTRLLEQYNDAIKMYNNALEYLYQKSDDMAIIQLKKAIEINPNFVDAINLLTLCYLIQKNKEKAQQLSERVLSIDINNRIAMLYYKELFPTKVRPEPVMKVRVDEAGRARKPMFETLLPKDKKSFGKTFPLVEALSAGGGALAMLIIMLVLILPGMVGERDDEIAKLQADIERNEGIYLSGNQSNLKKIADLEAENLRLIQENQLYTNKAAIDEKIGKIQQAATLLAQTAYKDAAQLLSTVDVTGLPQESADQANALKLEAYPLAASAYFDDAVQFYNSGDYELAKMELDKCLVFARADVDYMADAVYHLGLIAEQTGDNAEARTQFERVVTEFPGFENAATAQAKLNTLAE